MKDSLKNKRSKGGKRRLHRKLSKGKCCQNGRQKRSAEEDGFVSANKQKQFPDCAGGCPKLNFFLASMMKLGPEGDENIWGQERETWGGTRVIVALGHRERHFRDSGGLWGLAGTSADSSD